MPRRTKKRNEAEVQTIEGLQDLLSEASGELRSLKERDLPWVRVAVSTVNSGNSLIRTKLKIEAQKRLDVVAAT